MWPPEIWPQWVRGMGLAVVDLTAVDLAAETTRQRSTFSLIEGSGASQSPAKNYTFSLVFYHIGRCWRGSRGAGWVR